MAWFKGVATDYKDMLDQLAEICEDEHVATVAIYDGGSGYAVGDTQAITGGTPNHAPEIEVTGITTGDTVATVASIVAGGTGYTVGDTLTIDGGTFTTPCILEVVTEAAGVVTALQINDPGVYSVQPAGTLTTTIVSGTGNDDLTVTVTWNAAVTGIVTEIHLSDAGGYSVTPTSPVATTTSGAGVGLILATTYVETAWETLDMFDHTVAVSAVVAAGGTGYTTGQIINVEGGTVFDQAQFQVTAAAGVVTSVTLDDAGDYHTIPGNPVSTTTGGGGTGCTLTVTWNTAYSQRAYLHNTNSGVYLGIRTGYNSTYSAYTWQLAGYTGYTSSNIAWDQQPGFSGDDENFVSLANSSINYWLAISDNRIIACFEIGSSFPNLYMGLLEPFLTAAEYPYPLMILGSNTRARPASETLAGGMCNPGQDTLSSVYEGPGRIRKPDGSWTTFANWYGTGTPVGVDTIQVQPSGQFDGTPVENYSSMGWYEYLTDTDDRSWELFFQTGSFSDSVRGKLQGLNGEYVIVPLSLADHEDKVQYGKFEDAYWFDNFDYGVAAKDRILVSGVRYRVFHNCTHAYRGHYFCIREA